MRFTRPAHSAPSLFICKTFRRDAVAALTETSLTAEDPLPLCRLLFLLCALMKFVGGMLVDKINPKAMTGPVDWRGDCKYSQTA
ncbi:hypothetical protein KCP70_02095 [Salmonella enterica subsp. enterica]|nr:hypothetical protein KCP70_02095 [Salmonella enterica subsp. enterica]